MAKDNSKKLRVSCTFSYKLVNKARPIFKVKFSTLVTGWTWILMIYFWLASSSATENQHEPTGVNKAKLIFTTLLLIIVGNIFIPATPSSKRKTKIAFFIKKVEVGGVSWQDFSSEWVLILRLASNWVQGSLNLTFRLSAELFSQAFETDEM